MTLGLHESRLRQRRRRRLAIIKWVFMLAVFAVLGFWAYRTGAFLAEREVRELRTEIDRLTAALVDIRQEREALAAGIEAARQREAEWQTRYRQDVPTGQAKEIFQLAQQRIAQGVSADRLAFERQPPWLFRYGQAGDDPVHSARGADIGGFRCPAADPFGRAEQA